MIILCSGDLLRSDAEALVNTVNCVGVMGRGLALQFKTALRDKWEAYARASEAGQVQPGRMFVYDRHRLDNPRLIINLPTKRHWQDGSWIGTLISPPVAAIVAVHPDLQRLMQHRSARAFPDRQGRIDGKRRMRFDQKRFAMTVARKRADDGSDKDLNRRLIDGGDWHAQAIGNAVACHTFAGDRIDHQTTLAEFARPRRSRIFVELAKTSEETELPPAGF